jgi:hypothetical protein
MNNQTLKQNLSKIFLLKKSNSSTLYVIWKSNNKKNAQPFPFFETNKIL